MYAAFDREAGIPVALKRLARLDPNVVLRFKREFRALADISHPNLASLYELFHDARGWYFTMELVSGSPLTRYVQEASGSLDLETPQSNSASLEELSMGALGADPTIGVSVDSPRAQLMRTLDSKLALDRTLDSNEVVGRTMSHDSATMTPVPGFEPADIVIPASTTIPHPVDHGVVRAVFRQLATALTELHRGGMLHRDLKPSNVLVTDDGRVVVLDFGLVAFLDQADRGMDRVSIVGTPSYMAPEQFTAGTPTAAADWYAVGVMLFQILTGSRPFLGTVQDLMRAKQSQDGPEPRDFTPDVPSDLNALCRELLRREPAKRPTGQQVIERLGGRRDTLAPALPSAPVFVGREAEVAALEGAFAEVKGGTSITVHVQGHSGMGKTMLCEQVIGRWDGVSRALVLRGRCYEQESLPYKTIDSAIDSLSQLLSELPSVEVEALVPPGIEHLAHIFPVLRLVRAIRDRPAPLAANPVEARRMAFDSLRILLRRLALTRPVVLYVDDVHWGDSESATAVHRLMEPPDAPPMLMILSYRSEEAETSTFLRELSVLDRESSHEMEARTITVGSLSESACMTMVRRVASQGVPIQLEAVEGILEAANGHPYFLDTLLRFSHALRDLGTESDRRELLDATIMHRVSTLDDASRALLKVIALSGIPIDYDVAGEAAGLEALDRRLINQLRVAHLLRTVASDKSLRLAPYHDRIRESVTASLEPAEKTALHGTLAVSLEKSAAPPRILATHYHGAGKLDVAAVHGLAAAHQADEALAFDQAAELYGQVLQWAPGDQANQRTLMRKRGDALVNRGRCGEAAAVYEQTAELADEAESFELRRLAAKHRLTTGDLDVGTPLLIDLFKEVGLWYPKSQQSSIMGTIGALIRLKIRGTRYKRRPSSELDERLIRRADLCMDACRATGLHDAGASMYLAVKGLLLGLDAGADTVVAEGAFRVGATMAMLGNRDAEALLGLGHGLADDLNTETIRGVEGWARGFVSFFDDNYAVSLGHFMTARAHLRRAPGLTTFRLITEAMALNVLAYLQDFEELERLARELATGAREVGNPYMESLGYAGSAVAYLGRDEPRAARDRIALGLARGTKEDTNLGLTALRNSLLADFYEGKGRRAHERLEGEWPALKKQGLITYSLGRRTFGIFRAQACLARALEDKAQAAKLRKQAARWRKWTAKSETRFSEGPYLLVDAAIAAQMGEATDAVRLLERALAVFEEWPLPVQVAATRYQIASLSRDAEGLTDANRQLKQLGIVNPAAWTRAVMPGFPEVKQ